MTTDLYGDLPAGLDLLPEGKQEVRKVILKLHLRKDATYKMLAVTNTTSTRDVLALYAKKLGMATALGSSLELLSVDENGGDERVVGEHERPG